MSEQNADAATMELETLEQRIERLEMAIAALQDTRAMEDRVVEKVSKRMASEYRGSISPNGAEKIVDKTRHPLTVISDWMPKKKIESVPSAARTTTEPQIPLPASAPRVTPDMVQQAWFLVDVWKELVNIVKMFFDVRYMVGWWTRLTVMIMIPAILLTNWWVPFASVPVIGPIFDRAIGLVLAFFLYKTLMREASRYRQWKQMSY